MKDTISFNERKQVVDCSRLKPRALLMLDDCKKCEYHAGIKQIQPGNEENGIAPSDAVICKLPTRKQIHNLLGGKQ